jgi:hypothetical protein
MKVSRMLFLKPSSGNSGKPGGGVIGTYVLLSTSVSITALLNITPTPMRERIIAAAQIHLFVEFFAVFNFPGEKLGKRRPG